MNQGTNLCSGDNDSGVSAFVASPTAELAPHIIMMCICSPQLGKYMPEQHVVQVAQQMAILRTDVPCMPPRMKQASCSQLYCTVHMTN